MSKMGFATISCPQCGHESEARVYESINVTLDPEEKEAALSGTLSMFKCPECGLEAALNAPLLYHDMEQKLMIHVAPSDEDVEEAYSAIQALFGNELASTLVENDYTFRIVRTTNELKEKVMAFENGLDDRALEVCKLIIVSQLLSSGQELPDYEELLCAGESEEDGGITFVFVGEEGGGVTFPKDSYAIIADDVAMRDMPADEYVIDFEWARHFMIPDDGSTSRGEAEDQGEIVGDLRVVQIFGRPFRVPQNFVVLDSLPDDEPGQITYVSQDEGTNALLKVNTMLSKYAMPYKKQDKIIKGIHETLEEDQGLVEVGAGIMGYSGRHYAYSIVKTKLEPTGVQYCLTLHIIDDGYTIAVQGFFEEAGTTGIRDSIVVELERREGTIDISAEGITGWTRDPYDDKRTEGFLMNLSEAKKYDAMFPEHPLSELRNTLEILINNN